MNDFWLSSGHHLLDRDARGQLRVTDEFMKIYLARQELAPPAEACVVERTLHGALICDPWRPVAATEIDMIADHDARENWQFMIGLRDRLAVHRTIEAAYAALVYEAVRMPPLFLNQLVHLILRNALDQCDDAYVLRAAELLFRPQRMTVHNETLLAADQEHIDAGAAAASPLVAMFGLPDGTEIEVMSDVNASGYWGRSDRFDLALDLTAGRRGLAALGKALEYWLKHLIDIEVTIEPLPALRSAALSWYVGLDAFGTKIGDALWNGTAIDEATQSRIVGLFRLSFRDADCAVARSAGKGVYLILAMGADGVLRMKPHNLLTGLPVRSSEDAI